MSYLNLGLYLHYRAFFHDFFRPIIFCNFSRQTTVVKIAKKCKTITFSRIFFTRFFRNFPRQIKVVNI